MDGRLVAVIDATISCGARFRAICAICRFRERGVGAIPSDDKGQSGQRRKRRRAGLLHDRSAMALDGALAEAKIRGDFFARLAREDQFHDLALPWRELRKTAAGIPLPAEQRLQIFLPVDQLFDATKQHHFSGKSLTQPRFCPLALDFATGPCPGGETLRSEGSVRAKLEMLPCSRSWLFRRLEVKAIAKTVRSP